MKSTLFWMMVLAGSIVLTGCAGNSEASQNFGSSTSSSPVRGDNPPVTFSGYVDTGTTKQMR